MRTHPRGFVLITAALALLVVGVAALVLISEGGMGQRLLATDADRAELTYVTQAGLVHARWTLAQNNSCKDYTALPATAFGNHSYDAAFAPGAGSPLSVAVTGRLANGVTHTTSFTDVRTYDTPQILSLQLGKDPGKDTLIDDFYANANYGELDDLIVRSSLAWVQRPLLEFDLTEIPANATVLAAQLELRQKAVATPGVAGVHRVTRSWEEGTGKGTGGADGATWNKYDGVNPWSQPGGDFAATLYGTAAISAAGNGQFVGWDITNLVQGWVTGQFANFGLMLAGDGILDNAVFESREESAAAAPKLTVVYACECSVSCIGGVLNELVVLSTDSNATLGGLSFTDIDLAEYDRINDTATLYFDGALSTLDKKIDALHVLANGNLLLSADGDTSLGGINIEDGDLVEYDPVADAATMILDGSVRFVDSGEKLKSVHVLDDGHLILSTDGNATLGGVSFTSADLVEYDPATDTATLFFDASLTTFAKKIDAVHVQPDGHLVLSADGDATLGGLSFSKDDLIDYDPLADSATLLFDGALRFTETSERILSIQVGPGSGSVTGAPPPAAHWKFDEGSGSLAADSIGGHDGTVTGAAWSTGPLDGALTFSEASHQVLVPHSESLNLTDTFTFTAWINSNGNPGVHTILHKGAPGSEVYFFGANDDELELGFGGAYFTTSGVDLAAGTWHHVAATFDNDADEVRLYVDGVERLLTSTTLAPIASTGDTMLGRSNTLIPRPWFGSLDDLRIYDTVLAPLEISDLAEAGAEGIGGGCAVTIADDFETDDYDGGTAGWTTSWTEFNDTGGANAGDEQTMPHGGSVAVRTQDNDGLGEGIERELDLSSYATAQLSFDYWRDGLDDTNDFTRMEISDDGGSTWNPILQMSGAATDTAWQAADINVDGFMASNTRIRFVTSPLMGPTDSVFIDNVSFCLN